MTNHEKFVEAFRNRKGKELSTAEIENILLKTFPDMNTGSILPNDHAAGNNSACWCAGTENRIFDRIHHGVYRVR